MPRVWISHFVFSSVAAVWMLCGIGLPAFAGAEYTVEQAVAEAIAHNPDIQIARARLTGARGGIIEARAGYLPSVVSSGEYRKREEQASRLRSDDYDASVRVIENLYTAGATKGANEIARLNYQKQALELQSALAQVTLDVRLACYELLLNREKVAAQEQSSRVYAQELETQQARLKAGTVGQLDVQRAEVAAAMAEPALIDARSRLELSHLRLAELLGIDTSHLREGSPFEITGELIYEDRQPELAASLARTLAERPDLQARKIDIDIAGQQYQVDRSELRPQVQAFAGYEVYSERDADLGREFNHGYVVGINARWHVFDGQATQGRMTATKARGTAAQAALESAQSLAGTEVRSAFLDLQQADHILASEAKNNESASTSLELARQNLSAGLGTSLDVLLAAADLDRVRTSHLEAIYLHNAGLARLDRACGYVPAAAISDGK